MCLHKNEIKQKNRIFFAHVGSMNHLVRCAFCEDVKKKFSTAESYKSGFFSQKKNIILISD